MSDAPPNVEPTPSADRPPGASRPSRACPVVRISSPRPGAPPPGPRHPASPSGPKSAEPRSPALCLQDLGLHPHQSRKSQKWWTGGELNSRHRDFQSERGRPEPAAIGGVFGPNLRSHRVFQAPSPRLPHPFESDAARYNSASRRQGSVRGREARPAGRARPCRDRGGGKTARSRPGRRPRPAGRSIRRWDARSR